MCFYCPELKILIYHLLTNFDNSFFETYLESEPVVISFIKIGFCKVLKMGIPFYHLPRPKHENAGEIIEIISNFFLKW